MFEQRARVIPGSDEVHAVRLLSRCESSDSAAAQVAAALRDATAPVLLMTRPADRLLAEDEWLLRALGLRFSTIPDLAAIGLIADRDGTQNRFAALDDHLGRTRPPAWPAALAVRVTDTAAALQSLRGAGDDPLVEVAERLWATGARCEWRLYPSDAQPPPPWMGHQHADLTLGSRHDPTPVAPGEPPDPAAHLPGWVVVSRIVTRDGSRRIVKEGEPLSADERLDRHLFLARSSAFPDGVAITGGPSTLTEYRPVPDDAAPVVAHLHRSGLPGSAAVVVWHDPGDRRDFVGLIDEAPAGCHVSRVLGWGLEVPDVHAGEVRTPAPVDRALLAHRSTWTVEPVETSATSGHDRGVIGMLHRSPRPGLRRLCVGRRDDADVLTIDPFEPGIVALRHLGWIAPAATDAAPVVLRRRDDGHVDVDVGERLAREPQNGDLILGALERAPRSSTDVIPLPPPAPPMQPPGLSRRVRRRIGRLVRSTPTGPPSTLIVAPWFSVGGGDHFLLSLAGTLRAVGFPLRAVLTFDGASSPVDNRAAFRPVLDEIVCLPEERPGVAPVQAVAEMIRAHRIEQILLCGGLQLYSGLPALKAAYPDLRVVDQLFNDVGHIANNTRYHESIDLTICAYDALRSQLVDGQGRDPARVALAYIGIDTDHFTFASHSERRDAKRALGFDPDRDLWGYLGRISAEKSLSDFAAAAERIRGRHDAQLLIQGEGPGRADLEAAVAGAGVHIELRPFADDVRPTLRALDAYVLPSRTEGIPLGVMEAMASGALPVSTPVGGLPELVKPGINGYLAASGDPGALAIGLLAVARTAPGARAAMARNGRRRVEETMSLSAMGRRYMDLLGR